MNPMSHLSLAICGLNDGPLKCGHSTRPQPLRKLTDIRVNIVALGNENKGLLEEIIGALAWHEGDRSQATRVS